MRKLLNVMALLVISMLSFSFVSALDATNLQIDSIKVNGDEILALANAGTVLSVEEGQELSIRVGVSADPLLLNAVSVTNDIEVEAKISGYEHSDSEQGLYDSTHLFDLLPGTTKYVNLKLNLPLKLDKDSYTLRLRVLDKNTAAVNYEIPLSIEPSRHGIKVADVAFSPGNSVKAGRSLLATVLLENYGDKDESDIKVTVAIPSLGVSATEFVDVDTDNHNVDYNDVPEMFLPIPATAQAGSYDVQVTASYDDFTSEVTKTYTITVLPNEIMQQESVANDKLVLAVGPEIQTVAPGKVATYGIALTNAGSRSKAYVIEAVTGGWATSTISDSLVVLEPGKNKVVYVDLTAAQDATAGEHVASISIKSEGSVLQTVSLRGVVVQPATPAQPVVAQSNDSFSLRNGLEIAMIILVVVLVIIGVIIGFTRLKKDNEGEQTYY